MPKKKLKPKRDNLFCWVIAYIDSKFIHQIIPQLARSQEYKEVEVYIPTVKVLKKKFKGKEQFDEVPLLFNYGFFKIPRKLAVYRNYLENLQQNVTAIHGWVKDPGKILKKRGAESMKGDDRYISIATATSDEIARLVKASLNIGAHSADDIDMIKPGDMIVLRGYPFEGVEAELVEVDKERKRVKVILSALWGKQVEVSYDNVFFTIYQNQNYDDTVTVQKSLDEMQANNKLDKFEHKYLSSK
jgi:transcription antitermination factor NusG